MTFQYLLLSRAHPTLADCTAAIDLIKSLGGKCVGPFLDGIVYDLPRALSDVEREVIGVVEFV